MPPPCGALGAPNQPKKTEISIEIEIIRERRRTIALSHRGGQFVVKAPLHVDDLTIAKFIKAHEGWIKQKQRLAEESPRHAIFGQEMSWAEHGDALSPAQKDRIHKAQCMAELKKLYERTCEKHTARAPPLRIKSMASAWGKCFSTNRIELHWKVARLPPDLAEYVICHELAHLVHFDHSPQFWAVADDLCPGARRKDRELSKHSLDN